VYRGSPIGVYPRLVWQLREIFPVQFLHLSRFLTLLIGFALMISLINIYNRAVSFPLWPLLGQTHKSFTHKTTAPGSNRHPTLVRKMHNFRLGVPTPAGTLHHASQAVARDRSARGASAGMIVAETDQYPET
jgi:hypothetical protein